MESYLTLHSWKKAPMILLSLLFVKIDYWAIVTDCCGFCIFNLLYFQLWDVPMVYICRKYQNNVFLLAAFDYFYKISNQSWIENMEWQDKKTKKSAKKITILPWLKENYVERN